jgi:DNA-binding NarL/FixJ family response regulator
MLKLLIADDHTLFRDGLVVLLQDVEDISIVAVARDGEEAVEFFERTGADVALLDISMPKIDGIAVTRALKNIDPQVKVLILTMHEKEEYLFKIIGAGADGYLLKTAEKEELLAGIRAVGSGKSFFSAPVFELMTKKYVEDATNSPAPTKNLARLTNREQEILCLIAQGHTNPEIASRLFISPRTVDTHRTNLMQKLSIKNTAGLVRFALEQGLIPS